MTRVAMALGIAGVLALTVAARANPPASSLSWTRMPGAEGCIGAPELARAVEAKIGDILVTPAHADLSIEGRITPRRGGGWSAVVAVARAGAAPTSQRTLETRERDCHVLDTPLALVIALLVDPTGAPAASAPPSAPSVVIREVRIAVPVFVHEPWELAIAMLGGVEHGVLPGVALGGAFAFEVRPPGLPRLELSAYADRAQEAPTDLPARTVHESMVGGSLAACPAIALGAATGLGCAGARVSRLAWSGHGFERDLAGSAVVPAFTLDARVEWPRGARFALVAGAGLRVPLRHVEVSYERSPALGGGDVTVSDPARVSAWVGVGILGRVFPGR